MSHFLIKRAVRFIDEILEKTREIDVTSTRSHVRFYCRRVCMRLINRENRNLKGVDLTMRSTPGMACLGVMAAAFYRDDRFMYMPLDHSCTILFLAQLFTVITKTVTVLSLLLCPPTQICCLIHSIHATVVGGVLFRFL